MNLVLLDPGEVRGDGAVSLTGPRAAHLINVLKVEPGRQVNIGIVDGAAGVATVAGVVSETVELRCRFDTTIPPRPPTDLLLALPRPKVLRRLWAQLAALGVGRVILTNAARVERDYFDAHVVTPACYRPLLVEGLQQARDTRLPLVSIHRQFKVLVEDDLDGLFEQGLRLVAQPGRDQPVTTAIRAHAVDRLLLAIGPEGGWNDFELTLLEVHGFQAVSMGPRALRTDTACLALLALAHDALRPAATRLA